MKKYYLNKSRKKLLFIKRESKQNIFKPTTLSRKQTDNIMWKKLPKTTKRQRVNKLKQRKLKSSNTNHTQYRSLSPVFKKGEHILIHIWQPSCCTCQYTIRSYGFILFDEERKGLRRVTTIWTHRRHLWSGYIP